MFKGVIFLAKTSYFPAVWCGWQTNVASRLLTTSTLCYAGSKWRLEHGMGKCGNEYGPLQEIPDWSFADGRPAPLSPKEVLRREKQKDLALRAVRLINEMNDAKNNFAENGPSTRHIERRADVRAFNRFKNIKQIAKK